MAIIQTVRVIVLTRTSLYRSESQVLSSELNVEEYVQAFMHELGPDKCKADSLVRWTAEVDYHHDDTVAPDPKRDSDDTH